MTEVDLRAAHLLSGISLDGDVREALDELVIETASGAASRASNQVAPSDQDAHAGLYDDAEALASSVNNTGPEGQIGWLIGQGLSDDEIRSALQAPAGAPAGPGC